MKLFNNHSGLRGLPCFAEGIYWATGLSLTTPFTEGCPGVNNKASPPGRHQEQASKHPAHGLQFPLLWERTALRSASVPPAPLAPRQACSLSCGRDQQPEMRCRHHCRRCRPRVLKTSWDVRSSTVAAHFGVDSPKTNVPHVFKIARVAYKVPFCL